MFPQKSDAKAAAEIQQEIVFKLFHIFFTFPSVKSEWLYRKKARRFPILRNVFGEHWLQLKEAAADQRSPKLDILHSLQVHVMCQLIKSIEWPQNFWQKIFLFIYVGHISSKFAPLILVTNLPPMQWTPLKIATKAASSILKHLVSNLSVSHFNFPLVLKELEREIKRSHLYQMHFTTTANIFL